MAVRVICAGRITDGTVRLEKKHAGGSTSPSVASVLTNLEPRDPGNGPAWTIALTIGAGPSRRDVDISLGPIVNAQQYERSCVEPILIERQQKDFSYVPTQLALFRDRLFWVDNVSSSGQMPLAPAECEEAILRIKRFVYSEEEELNSLRSYVANVEMAREYQKSGHKREPIAADVKLLVWHRDGGACVKCGVKENLHFDHIIPVSKGGGSTAANIQLLCGSCNLKKSDKIAF